MNAPHRELPVPGARLRYRDDGAGRAVVLVHGWTLDLDMWEPQAPLAADLRLVRYDRRGFGLSTGQPSLADDVADLRQLIAALRIASPLLVGMSQGARVVLEFAARHPGVARGLVLDGPPPLSTGDGVPGIPDLPMNEFRQIAARDGLAAFRQHWRAHPLAKLLTADPHAHALLARMLDRYPGLDLLAATPLLRETVDGRLLAQVGVPALVINGARDTEARRRAGLALRNALPLAEHALVPDAAHLPNLDAPAAYNGLMTEFARRHLPAAA
jgi:pimeloyl-ACP methyl ester carboxylesterase